MIDVTTRKMVSQSELSGNGKDAYLVVFEMAPAAAGLVVVEVLGFGAVDATGLLEVAMKEK